MRTLLLIDDDYELYSLIQDYSTRTEFRVEHAGDATIGLSRIFEAPGRWDAVILDVMMPGLNGFEALKALRNSPQTADLPVLMLTALDGEYDRVAGLEGGADDYLVKPFSLLELVARLRAILRRSGRRGAADEGDEKITSLGDLVIRRSALVVEIEGRRVNLTPTEMRILETLAAEPGKTVGRGHLNQMLSSGQHNNRGLDMAVSRLRKKLGKREGGDERIQAVWGEGYIFLVNGDRP